jgi:hypothetical protein
MNKLIEVRHAFLGEVNEKSVVITDNGSQWRVVFTGTSEQCELITSAYNECGYVSSVGESRNGIISA